VVPARLYGLPDNLIVELTLSNWAVRTNRLSKFDSHYLVYLQGDPAKEPVAVADSAAKTLPAAAHKTGRAKADFELRDLAGKNLKR